MKTPLSALARFGVLGSVLIYGCRPVAAAVLDYVPMQGTMVHMNITFRDTPPSALSVIVDPVTVVLTPLSVSNPGDTFDPAHVWYLPLQGQSFSRRFGFVMADSDLMPNENYSVWVRWLEGSAGLKAYYYRRSGEFSPMLGTEGNSPVFEWNRLMFHPTFVAPAGTNDHYARMEVFLANTVTGQPVPGYSAAAFTIEFKNLPEPQPPSLVLVRTNNSVRLEWPIEHAGYVLESVDGFPATGQWTAVTNTCMTNSNRIMVEWSCAGPNRFFRLRK